MYPYVNSCLNYCTPMAMQLHLISKLGKKRCMQTCIIMMIKYSKPIFIRLREIFMRFARASLSQIYINCCRDLSLLYRCYIKTSVSKVWSQKIVVVNQFISSKSLNKVVANKNYDVN